MNFERLFLFSTRFGSFQLIFWVVFGSFRPILGRFGLFLGSCGSLWVVSAYFLRRFGSFCICPSFSKYGLLGRIQGTGHLVRYIGIPL